MCRPLNKRSSPALKQLKAVSAARTRRSAHVSAKLRAARKRCWNSCMPSFSQLVTRLKDVNDLNKQLTFQSLQFISLTFDMLLPNEGGSNYGKEQQPNQTGGVKRLSLFDSKA
ncbi:flagellar export chaperone FlgN [Bacillus licheniformis]